MLCFDWRGRSYSASTGKLGQKIDVYRRTVSGPVYVGSTNHFLRCKDAAASFERGKYGLGELFGRFDKRGK